MPGIGEVPVQIFQAMPYILTCILLAGFIGVAKPPRPVALPMRRSVKPMSSDPKSHALFEAAVEAMAFAYAPYSKFPVGAAIRAEDGKIYTGANIENISFPQGWCAEPSAISAMIMGGAKKISEVAVIAEKLPLCSPAAVAGRRLRNSPRRRRRFIFATKLASESHDHGRAFALRLQDRAALMTDGLIDILVERLNGLMPRVAIVLGSGLGSLVEEVSDPIRVPYANLPGFPTSGVSGHAGELVAGYLGGEPVMMLSGRVHYYERVIRPPCARSSKRLPVSAYNRSSSPIRRVQSGRTCRPARSCRSLTISIIPA